MNNTRVTIMSVSEQVELAMHNFIMHVSPYVSTLECRPWLQARSNWGVLKSTL